MPHAERTRTSRKRAAGATGRKPAKLAALPDDDLLEAIQRQTFRYFWDAAHPDSGLARDRVTRSAIPADDLIAIGGSGFGIMAMLVAVERRWISRAAASEPLVRSLDLLTRATCYHGVFPHFMNGRTGATIPFARKDDGGDLVETSILFMALLCAREYFDRATPEEAGLRGLIFGLWHDVEWEWYTRDGRNVLYWHWSPNNGWAMDHEIRGWNECLITYLLAAAALLGGSRHLSARLRREPGISSMAKAYYGIELPLGGALRRSAVFRPHYSFSGIDPRGLGTGTPTIGTKACSTYASITRTAWRTHCAHKGYGATCWGLTSSDDVQGYAQHAPDNDTDTISPTAALSSMPYTPRESIAAMRHFLKVYGEKVWGPYGFVDAFCEEARIGMPRAFSPSIKVRSFS